MTRHFCPGRTRHLRERGIRSSLLPATVPMARAATLGSRMTSSLGNHMTTLASARVYPLDRCAPPVWEMPAWTRHPLVPSALPPPASSAAATAPVLTQDCVYVSLGGRVSTAPRVRWAIMESGAGRVRGWWSPTPLWRRALGMAPATARAHTMAQVIQDVIALGRDCVLLG